VNPEINNSLRPHALEMTVSLLDRSRGIRRRTFSYTPWALQHGAARLLEAFERGGHFEAELDPLCLSPIRYVRSDISESTFVESLGWMMWM
jgi:hypothetical protein